MSMVQSNEILILGNLNVETLKNLQASLSFINNYLDLRSNHYQLITRILKMSYRVLDE